MKLVIVDELKEGMILGEDIVGKYSILYASKGTILNKNIIDGIKRLGIKYIYVIKNKDDDVLLVDKKLDKEYRRTLDYFKNVYFNVKIGKKIVVDELQEVVQPLVNEVKNSINILNRLKQMEINDLYTYKHSINVCVISTMIGKWMNFSQNELNEIAIAGLFHDIGKSKIPNEILNKAGKLTKEEFEVMKSHTLEGYKILKNTDCISDDIAYGALQHHERIDGKGYPNGLKNDQIHIYAKIISIADIYDAMTSNRVYRNKTSPFKVAELIFNDSFGHLDPHIANLFLKGISQFYVGNIVKLNNGEVGEVILVNKNNPTRPLVKVKDKYIDLSKNYSFEITDVIL
ncbi:HD-GYP domain, c-di-GMP phosphodiesterase class II (or its inactivated variant) [Caminicella sporogenes DSM 14501]|uniref:HD-GYP domain, c-di-GMP phosphodiesterase class II (Or its inactivated variant) n=1 Tax=Caminicella sporogenes DSM 14501 TaxID=1121266 RepID=A0A1M6T8G3_9FIRM|nr:HD-GYP domain-containing protein [Caminicella sporogenes]RKD26071.1 hypothetical protein BET04_10995 [Caminicella sporogenes]SHK53265.1 HD-GYP domain, c-di-GMP phosphodiesterase class II (or its inactivated variant) [Caminicella sporogenes DSM 14501]